MIINNFQLLSIINDYQQLSIIVNYKWLSTIVKKTGFQFWCYVDISFRYRIIAQTLV